MKTLYFTIIFLLFTTLSFSQQKMSIGIGVGTVLGFSSFEPIGESTPYFEKFKVLDLGYDCFLKYYPQNNIYLGVGIGFYGRSSSVRITDPNNGLESIESETIGSVNTVFSINIGYSLIGREASKNRVWAFAGVQMEKEVDRFIADISFGQLELYQKEIILGWQPLINIGLAYDRQLKNGNLGVKLMGGLGFVYRNMFYYRGYSEGNWYRGVSKFKGDYVGLLATWEYGLPRRYKKDKNKKSKNKKRK